MKWYCKRLNNQAMILVEMLLTLLIVSLMMHSMFIAIASYQRLRELNHDDKKADWHQLLALLESEISLYQVTKVDANKIYLKDDTGNYQVILSNHKIYKTPGYHPYAYEVSEWQLIPHEHYFEIIVTYDNQQTYYGWVYYETS